MHSTKCIKTEPTSVKRETPACEAKITRQKRKSWQHHQQKIKRKRQHCDDETSGVESEGTVHKGEAALLVVLRRGGQRAGEAPAEGAGGVELRGRPARGHGVHAALHAAPRAAAAAAAAAALAHQVHAHLAQVLCAPGKRCGPLIVRDIYVHRNRLHFNRLI